MGDLRAVEDLPAGSGVNTHRGTMVKVAGVLQVNVWGKVLPAQWADPLVVAEGDPVLVEISGSREGQGAAFVRCRLTDKPRPGEGTILTVPPGSPTVTVTGSDGVVYTAKFVASYTPVVGEKVLLSWNAAIPTVSGKITTTPAATTPPPSPVGAPPSGPASSYNTYPASASDTYLPAGGWGAWAGGGSYVHQGSYGSGPVYGAWFYAGSAAQLAGKIITRIRFRLGARRPVGNNNSPVNVNFYAHNSANKPGGDVTRVSGPHTVVAQPGQGITEYDLPLSFAAALQGGGGIAIAGEPYCGFFGVSQQPESGLLILDWRT